MDVKKILVSQQLPMNMAPYEDVSSQFGADIDFIPLYTIEPLTSREFRSQKINLPDYTAIVFSARQTIDAFFLLCEELRVKVPESMKYFCTTEAVAMYLQKHIIFRKRKIFYGNGTAQSVMDLIGSKHRAENFLITTSDSNSGEVIARLFEAEGLRHSTAVFVKSVSRDLQDLDPGKYDLAVIYNPADLASLNENFPGYTPGKTRFITFGKTVAKAAAEAGLPVDIQAPTPEVPSAAKAIKVWLENNK